MIYDRFMYIHIDRTAGNAFFAAMSQVRGLEVLEGGKGHAAHDELAAWCVAHGHPVLPAVTFVRNPWDWYVAMWSWVCYQNYAGFFESFEEYMRIVYEERSADRPFRRMSWHWADLQCDKARCVGRLEHFSDDVVRILVDIAPDLITRREAEEIVVHVGEHKAVKEPNPWLSRDFWQIMARQRYKQFHTRETREWVAELDRDLTERFGYTWVS